MSKRKKIAIWVMGVIGALLVLLLVLMLLLPRIINLEPIKQKIIARISQEVGGEVEFQRALTRALRNRAKIADFGLTSHAFPNII